MIRLRAAQAQYDSRHHASWGARLSVSNVMEDGMGDGAERTDRRTQFRSDFRYSGLLCCAPPVPKASRTVAAIALAASGRLE